MKTRRVVAVAMKFAMPGSGAFESAGAEGGDPASRLYDTPPPGLAMCKACGRLMVKRKG